MILDNRAIRGILEHRYPFLLVDKIIEMDDNFIKGVKNISATDPFLAGHFPDNPVYPGVLLIESCAQVGGILISKHLAGKGFLAKIQDFTFTNFVQPGDSIYIEVQFINKFSGFAKVGAVAKVDDRLVGKGEIIYSFLK
jgi:3-hydroxyacyl-[acyl-carrier-protein] dehydratase